MDIQGLRGVAVLLVVIFHIWTDRVSGGVDVFFVLSAFLLTGAFLRRFEAGKPLGVPRYWLRTFSRLIGPVAVMLIAFLAALLAYFPPSRWGDLVLQAWGSLFYVVNWVLADQAVDYYAGNSAATTPLQHMWSLSIQGQVFILWPLLLAMCALVAKRSTIRFRTLAWGVFGSLYIGSLTWSILQTAANPEVAYFSTFTRLWEFSLGSLIALLLSSEEQFHRVLPGRSPAMSLIGLCLGWVGLAAVVVTPFVVGDDTRFPGTIALAPTLGAAAILVAGAWDQGGRVNVGKLLSAQLLRWIGDRAYGIYLWHWPLLITYLMQQARDDVPVIHGLGIIAMSVVLTWATSTWLKFWHNAPGVRAGQGIRLVATALLVAVPLTGAHKYTVLRDPSAGVERTEENYPGAAVLRGDISETPDVPIIPTGAEREYEWGDTGQRCSGEDYPEGIEDLGDCWVIEPKIGVESERTIVVIGDSHAQQLLTPIHRAATNQNWTVISYLRMACRYTSESDNRDDECNEFNAAAREAAMKENPDAILTIGTLSLEESPHEKLVDGYEEGVDPFLQRQIPVLAFRDNPRFTFSMFACVETYGPDHERCNPPRSESLLPVNPLEELSARNEDLHTIDLTDRLCTDTTCPGVIGNIQVYMDLDHVTSTYGETLAPDVEARIMASLGW